MRKQRPLHSKTQGICMENSQRWGMTWTSNSSTQSLGKSYSSAHIFMDIEIFKTRTQRTVGAPQGMIKARRGRKWMESPLFPSAMRRHGLTEELRTVQFLICFCLLIEQGECKNNIISIYVPRGKSQMVKLKIYKARHLGSCL